MPSQFQNLPLNVFIRGLLSSKYTYIVIILITSIGVYLNTLSNDFVYDDEFQILKNPWITDVRYVPEIFFSDVWAFKGEVITNYYRPVMHIILMIDYYIFGLNPWGFHLTNIIFHSGITVLVFLTTSALLNQRVIPAAFVAALLFATHPIHTEVVAWVSGIPELSFTFFYLLSFYLYIIKADAVWGKLFISSLLFFFLSTLCKETALTLPMLLLVHDYSFKKDLTLKLSSNTFNLLLKRYLPYLIVAGIYFVLRTYAIGGFAPLKRHSKLSNYQYIINVFPLFVQYLEKLILPINLNAYHVLYPMSSIFEWKGIVSILLTSAFTLAIYFLRRINRLIFFTLLWIVIPLLPVLYIPALGEASFTERYLYLPSVGFVILTACLLAKTFQFRIFGQTVLYVIAPLLIMITAFYSAQTIKRNFTWKDNYTLWSDTVEKSPDGAEPHNNLGNACYGKGFTDKAMEHFQIAVGLKPDYAEAYNNLGNIYYDKGFIDKALEYFQFATRLKPNYAHAYYNLGTVYYDRGLIDKAIEQYQIAIRLKPYFPKAHYNLGIAYDDTGFLDMAAEHYQIAVTLRPNYPEVHNNLGIIYAKQGQWDKAISEFNVAIQLNPYDAEAHYNLGNALYKKGATYEAIKEFQTTIKLKPNHAGAISKLKNIQGN